VLASGGRLRRSGMRRERPCAGRATASGGDKKKEICAGRAAAPGSTGRDWRRGVELAAAWTVDRSSCAGDGQERLRERDGVCQTGPTTNRSAVGLPLQRTARLGSDFLRAAPKSHFQRLG
jgi:hypothetical protein